MAVTVCFSLSLQIRSLFWGNCSIVHFKHTENCDMEQKILCLSQFYDIQLCIFCSVLNNCLYYDKECLFFTTENMSLLVE